MPSSSLFVRRRSSTPAIYYNEDYQGILSAVFVYGVLSPSWRISFRKNRHFETERIIRITNYTFTNYRKSFINN